MYNMAKIKSIRGTKDILPGESYRWQYIERVAFEVARSYGMEEIRTPTFEKTELFVRSVGETTDVVQKEMYTWDQGRESLTLRPEGTAGTVRAILQNNLLSETLPVKVSYKLSCFRHENPQAGRYREFNQFGIECFGSPSPSADAEVIGVARDVFDRLGIDGISLEINSIGCPKCRPDYNKLLVEYFRGQYDDLCETCKQRIEKNPLRLLDCKEEKCKEIAKDAPLCLDHLCEECGEHFDGLKTRLDAMNMVYSVNPRIVRGLDYYTKTVFEFIADSAGAQGTVCGGGRYDLLVEQMGGPHTPALGFGMGLERLLMVMDANGCEFPEPTRCDIYIGSMGEQENIKALELCTALRKEGFVALCDTVGRSVKAQMRYADKMSAAYSCIIGSQELENGQIRLRNMEDGENIEADLDAGAIMEVLYSSAIGSIIGEDKAAENMLGMLMESDMKEKSE